MPITRKQVEHVAKLARLALTPDQADAMAEQLSKILDHAERVTGLDTQGVEATAHAISLTNVMRPDVVADSLSQAEALAVAPVAEKGHFRVPPIPGEE